MHASWSPTSWHPNLQIQVDTPARNNTTDAANLSAALMGSLGHTVGFRLSRDLTWGPPQTRHEVWMGIVYGSDATSILLQVPTSYRLVICRGEQKFTTWMENKCSNPVIMTSLAWWEMSGTMDLLRPWTAAHLAPTTNALFCPLIRLLQTFQVRH